ncbi:MAG: glycosyltransferase family 4 protein [Moorea sp. SIO4A3]|nr:glycosyltransferase family 4 protein [Moorena sp. SIO4A3]
MKVFMVCSGLGNVKRGFESFTQECFEALSKAPSVDITLFKGGGESHHKAITLWNFHRDSWLAIQLGKLTGRGSYFIEQASFAFSLLPYIHRQQPDVIYFSDGAIGNILWHWRRLTKQNYKLLFSNGGPLSPPFHRWDCVQQVTPTQFQIAIDAGEPAAKLSLVPYGIKISTKLQILSISERKALRCQLGLPENQPIILSVGAINKSHKRMDYVIREIATLPEPRPYVLLLGQQEAESSEIIELGNQLLGADNFQVRTVASHEVANYYKVANAFVLASLGEGFGRVFLEAMSHGLPCLAHDYDVARFVLGKEGYLANFELTGSLATLVSQVLAEGDKESKRHLRHQSIYERFSWEKLRPAYVEMIECCITGKNKARSLSFDKVSV